MVTPNLRADGGPPRLVQCFMYARDPTKCPPGNAMADNHYAHPLDLLPIVDLGAGKVVDVQMYAETPDIPWESVQYHRDTLATNDYLETGWREDPPRTIDITQPDGPSFAVDGHDVSWQKWTFTVGFNYREGLVLHDLKFDGRPVCARISMVEMAVPYGDPHAPFARKCAFDVGDYGLGNMADSLQLGCDCLGHIHYFDGVLSNAKGEPVEVPKVVSVEIVHRPQAGQYLAELVGKG